MESLMVPLTALAISLATFFFTVISNARKANVDQLDKLERDLSEVRERLDQCEADRFDLRSELLELKRKV